MPDSIIIAEVGFIPYVNGIRIAVPLVGPIPGKTPTSIPTKTPIKQ
jgi:hypothetical protein